MRLIEFPIALIIFGCFILVWVLIYTYDCIKMRKIPDFLINLRQNWWAYALFLIAILLCLSQLKSCSAEEYDRGYEAGYEAGVKAGIDLVKEDPANYLDW